MRNYSTNYLNPCGVESCGRNVYAKNYCRKHYSRLLRTGTVEELPKPLPKMAIPCKVQGCSNTIASGLYCARHNYRLKKYGDVLHVNRRYMKGLIEQDALLALLRTYGHKVMSAKIRSGIDLIMGEKLKIEVKCADRNKDGDWKFNLHHGGKLREVADYYIFIFMGVPDLKDHLYAAFKCPMGRLTVSFSVPMMIRTLAPAVELFQKIKHMGAAILEETQDTVVS